MSHRLIQAPKPPLWPWVEGDKYSGTITVRGDGGTVQYTLEVTRRYPQLGNDNGEGDALKIEALRGRRRGHRPRKDFHECGTAGDVGHGRNQSYRFLPDKYGYPGRTLKSPMPVKTVTVTKTAISGCFRALPTQAISGMVTTAHPLSRVLRTLMAMLVMDTRWNSRPGPRALSL